MNKPLLKASLLFLFSLGSEPMFGADYLSSPSDPLASLATKNVYSYLASRRDQSENRMIEGQHLGGINDIVTAEHPDAEGLKIENHYIDGKLPGFVGTRYDASYLQVQEPYPYVLSLDYCTTINNELIEIWNAYQPIIQITAVPRNPWNPDVGRSPDTPSTQKISALLADADNPPGSINDIAHQSFWAEIDLIGTALQQLEDAGVPIVFRPFAEFNQSNKYYFEGQLSTHFKALWIDVYEYYISEPPLGKGLHNLLFCWEVWALNCSPASANIGPWHPGSDYVDVVAGAFYFEPGYDYFDADGNFTFAESPRPAEDQAVYNYLVGRNRPFGAAQYGLNKGTPNIQDHRFTRDFMEYSTAAAPTNPMAFAYYWSGNREVQLQANAVEFVNDAWVATADDLPAFNPASVTLDSLSQIYDGAPKPVTAITDPADLSVSFTYDGSNTPPINAGTYSVVGTVTSPHYTGSAAGTLAIAKASQLIDFQSFSPIYYGDSAPPLLAGATSGQPVVFSILSGNADIESGTLSYHSTGTIIIEANADGGTNYEPAESTQQSLQVLPSFYSWIENAAPLEDANADGILNLLAYGLGLSPTARATQASEFSPGLPYVTLQDGTVSIEFVTASDRTDIAVIVEGSTDMQTWTELPFTVVATSGNWRRCRAESATGSQDHQFMRVRVQQEFVAP